MFYIWNAHDVWLLQSYLTGKLAMSLLTVVIWMSENTEVDALGTRCAPKPTLFPSPLLDLSSTLYSHMRALTQTLDYNFTSTSPSQCSLPSEPTFSVQWQWIYENHIYVNCGLNNEYESDLRSNEHYLSSREKWKLGLKKSGLYIQAWIVFRTYFNYYLSSIQYCKDGFHIHILSS